MYVVCEADDVDCGSMVVDGVLDDSDEVLERLWESDGMSREVSIAVSCGWSAADVSDESDKHHPRPTIHIVEELATFHIDWPGAKHL